MIIKTVKATITIGVNEGYKGENEIKNPLELANIAWQEAAATIYSTNQLYISAVSNASNTLYHTDWGCPKGGEDTVTFTTSANPDFTKDMKEWKNTVIEVVKKVKEILHQSTVVIEFQDIEMVYLKDLPN